MIKSMTAYGRGEYSEGGTLFVAEIKTLNNRHRDISLRIPPNFQVLDNELKNIIFSRVKRGRIEASIRIEQEMEENPYNLELNIPLLKAYLKIFRQLSDDFSIDSTISAESICQMKDILVMKPRELDVSLVAPGFRNVLVKALDSLDEMKFREGQELEKDFDHRLQLLETNLNDVEKRAPFLVEEYRNRLSENIKRILNDVEVDQTRLAQEVAFFAERSDITEEKVRIRSHLKLFREYLTMDDALGRRLDFLIQEINREVNTIGSKAGDVVVAGIVVEMKAELEKIREQVQNIE